MIRGEAELPGQHAEGVEGTCSWDAFLVLSERKVDEEVINMDPIMPS